MWWKVVELDGTDDDKSLAYTGSVSSYPEGSCESILTKVDMVISILHVHISKLRDLAEGGRPYRRSPVGGLGNCSR